MKPLRQLKSDEILELMIIYLTEVSSIRDLDDVLDILADMGRALTSADRCTVWVVCDDKKSIFTKVAHGIDNITMPIDSGIVGASITNQKKILIDDVYDDARFNFEIDEQTGYRTKSMIVIPMFDNDDEVIGAFQVLNSKSENSVFNDADSLQAALDDLQEHGFMRQELSILADDRAVQEKLGHIYKRVEEAEDDPAAPRTIFVSNETMGEAEGTAIGLPLYVAATTATGIVAASGGTLLSAIIAATATGVVGAAIGAILAGFIAKHHADYIQEQIDHGGLLLWVHLRSPDMEDKAREVLGRHSAHDVHIHEVPLYG